jgi:hypothetical protein
MLQKNTHRVYLVNDNLKCKRNRSCLGGWYQWKGEEVGKGCGRVNIVQILCTHVCKWKMRPVETIPGMGGEGIKKNDGGGEFNYDIL